MTNSLPRRCPCNLSAASPFSARVRAFLSRLTQLNVDFFVTTTPASPPTNATDPAQTSPFFQTLAPIISIIGNAPPMPYYATGFIQVGLGRALAPSCRRCGLQACCLPGWDRC
jgi:hypothetical protein